MSGPSPSDLHTVLYPETFRFQTKTENGKGKLVSDDYEEPDEQDRFGIKILNDLGLPEYAAKDVQVKDNLVGEGYITLVWVQGKEMCCKSGGADFWQSIEREYDYLCKVMKSHIAKTIQIPRYSA